VEAVSDRTPLKEGDRIKSTIRRVMKKPLQWCTGIFLLFVYCGEGFHSCIDMTTWLGVAVRCRLFLNCVGNLHIFVACNDEMSFLLHKRSYSSITCL